MMTTTQDTSREALTSVTPVVPTIRQRIYNYIAEQGEQGATADQIEAALDIPGSTVRPRLHELEFDLQAVWLTGVTRLTRRGRKACIYIARAVTL
jgi:hypothetical protein